MVVVVQIQHSQTAGSNRRRGPDTVNRNPRRLHCLTGEAQCRGITSSSVLSCVRASIDLSYAARVHNDRCCYSGVLPLTEALDIHISAQRLGPYMEVAFNDPNLARALYVWNREISSAFFEDISVLEVALRNAIHRALSDRYGDDWYATGPVLDSRAVKDLAEAWERIPSNQRSNLTTNGKIHGRVVANCMFGFWTNLLDAGGPTSLPAPRDRVHYDTLWDTKKLTRVFKGLKAVAKEAKENPTRAWVHHQVKEVKDIRNRISHHESLVDGYPLTGQHDTNQRPIRRTTREGHEACMRVARMLDTNLANWIRTSSRVPLLLDHKPTVEEHSPAPCPCAERTE